MHVYLALLAAVAVFLTHPSNVTAIPLADFYPFGDGTGDTALPQTDDGSSPEIDLSTSFPFFNKSHSTLFVNNNGVISFGMAERQYTPLSFPLADDRILIAPFWADVDTRGTGSVWYRETTGNISFLDVTQQIFTPTLLFIATWDQVGYYSNEVDKTNTFQCVLATNGVNSYVTFLYADDGIQWTTTFTRVPAQVGFNAGDGINFANVPGSQTSEIINIASTSNIGIDGVWIFRVDGEKIVTANVTNDPCDDVICVQGTCSILDSGFYGCECFSNYTGIMCNETVQDNTCPYNPCLNGGSCVDLSADSSTPFMCMCPIGYTGRLCECDQPLQVDCSEPQDFLTCFEMCNEFPNVDLDPCTALVCNSYTLTLDTCALNCKADSGAEMCSRICNIQTYRDRFDKSCVVNLCGDLTDPTSCPFVGMDCKDPDSTTCRSLCTSVNIGGVSAACASLHAGLCIDFLEAITNSDKFDSSAADTVVDVAENFIEDLDSSLGYIDILFEYLDNFTNDAVTYLQSKEIEDILVIFEDYFNDTRTQEWNNLQNGSSQRFLQHIESFGMLLAEGNISSNAMQFNGMNIGVTVDKPNMENVVEGSYQLSRNSQGMLTMASIPVNLLCEDNRVNEDCATVSTFVVRNLPMYLDGFGSDQANSVLLSTQVLPRMPNLQMQLNNTPIQLAFDQIQVDSASSPYCAFWNFTIDDWSTTNVTTLLQMTTGSRVICNTTHLTSFAVLVQVVPTKQSLALSLVSYIGCGISIVCLVVTIITLLLFRKKLNKGALLYIHLNLAIALLLALVVFVAGIESATAARGACILVAALLHYFFLCVFCWMLAEGIMLYLLVVRVFGTAAEKWYYLLILGWGVPVPIVAISAAILHKDYGNSNYCWITANVERPAIWLFVGPMLLVIMINTVILIMTVASVVRGKLKGGAEQDVKTRTLVKSTIKGTIILLPLLGLTWVFGLFAVNDNTVAFAWLFTIFNSLQGVFIFTLHVLRNKHVLAKIKKMYSRIYSRKPKESKSSSIAFRTLPDSVTKDFTLDMKSVHTEELVFANPLGTAELSPVSPTSDDKTPLRFGDEQKANENS